MSLSSLNPREKSVSLVVRLYVWSLIFEPLLYFIILPQNITGVGGNISRVFQFLVIITIFIKFVLTFKIRFIGLFSSVMKFFSYYYFYLVLVGLIGLLTGSYSYNQAIDNPIKENLIDTNSFAVLVQSPIFRPAFEYFIALYYFVYFVVLSQFIFISKQSINYFFKWFNVFFVACILIGFTDLLLINILSEEYNGIGRHIADKQYPGNRFHGIAGEPRDAFVYLILCFGILSLRDIWGNKNKLTFLWVIIILIAIFLTQSFSGIIGIIISIPLLLVFGFNNLSIKQKLFGIFLFLIAIFVVYLNINFSIRMTLYFESFIGLYQDLKSGNKIDNVLKVTLNNIYPIWHLWQEVKDFNFFHLFFGNGLGSASLINNYYYGESELLNPNASLVRMLYESGIIGILLFILAFVAPIRSLNINRILKNKLLVLMLILLGTYLSHRSVAPYIYLGLTLSVIRYKTLEVNSNISKYE